MGLVLLLVAVAVFLNRIGSPDPFARTRNLFPGWAVELFGAPQVVFTKSTLELAGTEEGGGENGFYLRTQIESGKVYRLRIEGAVRGGSPLLRTRIDDNEPNWLLAPDGHLNLTVTGGTRLETLIYGRGEFSYGLKSLLLEPCDACLTDPSLQEYLLTEIPELSHLLATDQLSAASRILDWAANVVDLGGGLKRFQALAGSISGLSAAQIYQDIWLPDAGGASCDGFAVFLQKVLTLFGMNAFTVDMGLAGTPLTHVTTVVAAEDGRFYVFDPTLNGIYTGPSGAFVDLETVLLGGTPEDTFHTRLIKRTILDVASAPDGIEAVIAKQLGVRNPDCASVDAEYVRCIRVPYDVRYLRYGWADDLAKYHIAEGPNLIIALMRRAVLRVSHTAGEDVRQRFIAMLKRAGVPVQAQ
jgi:hypothetical protein